MLRRIFLGVILAVTLTGCAASRQYMKPEESLKIYNKTYDQVFDAVPQIVKNAKMVFVESRKDDGVVDVVAPPSFWTSSLGNMMQGGDKVTLAIKKVSETSTSVEIASVSRGDLVDFGRSARVVGTLFREFDKALR